MINKIKKNRDESEPRYIPRKKAAFLLGVGIEHINCLHDEGHLEFLRVGKVAVRVSMESLNKFIRARSY